MKKIKIISAVILLICIFSSCRRQNISETKSAPDQTMQENTVTENHNEKALVDNVESAFTEIYINYAQEIVKSPYRQITTFWDIPRGIPTNTLYFKIDAVFLETQSGRIRRGVEYPVFGFIEFPDIALEPSFISGPVELPVPEPGQFVTVYIRILPETWENTGIRIALIDNIATPAENFTFYATHRTTNEVVLFPYPSGRWRRTIYLTLGVDTDVQVIGETIGFEGIRIVPILTAEGFGGWIEYRGNIAIQNTISGEYQ